MVAAIPTSTQNSCCHTYIYSKRLPPYLHLFKTVAAIPTSTQNGCCHTYIYSKKRRERFLIHEIRRIDGGRGFQTSGKVLRIDRNTFYNQKNKIPMKIPKFKRSGIGIIVELRRIPSGFPNQGNGDGNNIGKGNGNGDGDGDGNAKGNGDGVGNGDGNGDYNGQWGWQGRWGWRWHWQGWWQGWWRVHWQGWWWWRLRWQWR
jgi:hypothetical protein